MFKKILLFIVLLVSVFLSGCATAKPYQEVKVQEDKALVYVYRPESLIYRGTPYYIFINGEKTKDMIINASYIPFQLKAGRTSISLRENSLFHAIVDEKNYFFKAGHTYYIRINSGLYGAFTIEQVSPEVGSKEIKETKMYIYK